jgi:hypothetical protein
MMVVEGFVEKKEIELVEGWVYEINKQSNEC